ncbi:unnamed protein product [Hymenolepis diminuta]|uniref:Uncharacterized protein n=1 Tax=Hymenolepis diminuta TaxID=6216 RepID=A0A564Z1B8_HYMDI|nr:unnamed protein product [Hymenolepis diminuta]
MGHHLLTYNTQSSRRHNVTHRPTFKDIHDSLGKILDELSSSLSHCSVYSVYFTRQFEKNQYS